jgi:hypothetical protein
MLLLNMVSPSALRVGFLASIDPHSSKSPTIRDDEAALTAAIITFATEYGRYGYRRIAALLRDAGWW